jgi:hypothetical protein
MESYEIQDGYRVKNNQRIASVFEKSEEYKERQMGEKLLLCSKSMSFWFEKDNPDNVVIRSRRCHSKFCTVCESLRGHVIRKNLKNSIENCSGRLFFLTLTLPQNCMVFGLKQSIADVKKFALSFFRKGPFKKVLGTARFVEFTVKNENYFHTHLHCLIEMPKMNLWNDSSVQKLFRSTKHQKQLKKYFCSQFKEKNFETFEMSEIQSLKRGYIPPSFLSYLAVEAGFGPIVDIRLVKSGFEKEIVKYVTKSWEIHDDLILDIYREIKGMRFYSLTGSLKKMEDEEEIEKKEFVYMGDIKKVCINACFDKKNDVRLQSALKLAVELGLVEVSEINLSKTKNLEREVVNVFS